MTITSGCLPAFTHPPSPLSPNLNFCKKLLMSILPRTRTLITISINKFPSQHHHYATLIPPDGPTPPPNKDNLIADYLVKSIGLSRKDAIITSSKVSHLKSTENPASVINFFKLYGSLNKSQIKDVVFSVPRLLTHRADQNLQSKIIVLSKFGLSGSNLVKYIKKQPQLFDRGLDTIIVPTLSYLNEFLGGCNEDLVIVLCRAPWLLGSTVRRNLEPNLLLLKDFGYSENELRKFFITKPRVFMLTPECLQNVMDRVEKKLGIPRDSKMFIRGVFALSDVSDTVIEKKVNVFRSFGWSDSDIYTLFRSLPQCAVMSEVKIRNALTFFMKELGFSPTYLASLPPLLTCSLEKRVKPRYEVLKTLKEHKIVKSDRPLYSFITYSEEKFLTSFVLPYEEKIPSLYETYITTMNVKHLSKA